VDWHEALRRRVGEERLAHCERTAQLCREMARRHPAWGIDPQKAYVAGLLHDWGRGEGGEGAMLRAARRYGIPVDEVAAQAPVALLHAPVGAAALKAAGLEDEDILAAVATHTLGDRDMTPLQALVYVADYCEPGRTHPGAEPVRRLLEQDLWGAVRLATQLTLLYLIHAGRPIHPQVLRLWNELAREEGARDLTGEGGACQKGV
jgi:predicted HD superfamily hydrolase involved in NAD metabolism